MDDAYEPVLVGVGTATQRCADPTAAAEPLELMRRALAAAGADSGAPGLLAEVGDVAVPHGRWDYADPGRALAARIGAPRARTVLAEVGVLQQTLIGRACALVAAGEVDVAAVVGGEAGHRLRRGSLTGTPVTDTVVDGEPDVRLAPDAELRVPAEKRAGMAAPVGLYAITGSAHWSARGWTPDEGRDRIAALYSGLSAVSVGNPEAWRPESVSAADIRADAAIAFPYGRRHLSSWSVDQAGALLVCSRAAARRAGVPADRWVYPLVGVESNAMVGVARRERLDRPPGLAETAAAVYAHTGLTPAGFDLVDLYSCFPIAVELAAEAYGLSVDRPLTVTGGMPWAGGPYNNYVLQATARTARLLRAGHGRTGLVTSVSGVLTKHGATVWSTQAPSTPYRTLDVTTGHPSRGMAPPEYDGPGRIVGCTVLAGEPDRGVAVVDLADGRRAVATTTDPAAVAALEAGGVGRSVRVAAERLQLGAP